MSRTLTEFKLDALQEVENLIEECTTIKQTQSFILIFKIMRFLPKKSLWEVLELLINKFSVGGLHAENYIFDESNGLNKYLDSINPITGKKEG